MDVSLAVQTCRPNHRKILMSDSPTTAAVKDPIVEAICSFWWLMLLRGILLIALGIYALANPGMTLLSLTMVIAAFVLVDGIFAVVAGIFGWTESRGWTLLRGVIGILVGLFVLAHPLVIGALTATIVMIVLGVQALIAGVLEIVTAIRERKQIEGEGWLMLNGVLSIVFGLILIAAPFASSLVMIRILGVFAICFGIALAWNSFRLRSAGKSLQEHQAA